MPFRADPFLTRLAPVQRVRRRRWPGYAVVLIGLPLAIWLRTFFGDTPVGPFILLNLVIILAALLGGFRAGVLAVALSAFAAADAIRPPMYHIALEPGLAAGLAIYVATMMVLVSIIAMLNHAIDRMGAQAESVRRVMELQPTGFVGVDARGSIQLVNRTAEKQFGYSRQELLGKKVEMLVNDEIRALHASLREAYLAAPEQRAMGAGRDLTGQRKDGTSIPVEVGLTPVERGGAKGALATIIDITERKAAERRQKVLTDEIRHRGRNLVTVISAIATRMLPSGAVRTEFLAVLAALARTQDLFAESGGARLDRILARELEPFARQATITGCELDLAPAAAQDFALIVHELATNAAKYGALSRAEGKVDISGAIEDGQFVLTWQESGGPPVEPPQSAGFGQTILNDVAGALGAPTLAYEAAGFRYQLRADHDRIHRAA